MPYKTLLNKTNTIQELEIWRTSNYDYFLKTSKKSACTDRCYKWMNNQSVLPCICKERENECFLTQFYYEVNKVLEYQDYEVDCEEAILDFYNLSKNFEEHKKWSKTYQTLYYEVKSLETFKISKPEKHKENNYIVKTALPRIFVDFLSMYHNVFNNKFENHILSFEFLELAPLQEYPKEYLKSLKHLDKSLINGKYINSYLRNNIHLFKEEDNNKSFSKIYETEYFTTPKLFFHKTRLIKIEYSFEITDYNLLKLKLQKDISVINQNNLRTIIKDDKFIIFYLDKVINLIKKDCNTIILSVSKNEKQKIRGF